MSSKLKDISTQVDQRSLGNGLDSNQTVTPVEDAAIFNNVMSSTSMQSSTDKKESGAEEQKTKEVSGAKAKKTAKADEAKDTDSQVQEQARTQEENKEIEEVDAYEISVNQLAQQLNVALQAEQQNAKERVLSFKERMMLEDSTEGVQEVGDQNQAQVDPELLRKVDIKTLKKQLDLAVNQNSEVDVEVPREAIDRNKNLQDVALNEEVPELTPEEEALIKFKVPDFLKANDIKVAPKEVKETEKPQIDLLKADVQELRALPKEENNDPRFYQFEVQEEEVTLNVVSLDLTRQNEDDQSWALDLLKSDDLLPVDLLGNKNMPTVDPNNMNSMSQLVTNLGSHNSSQPTNGLFSAQAAGKAIDMAPLRVKVSEVITQMGQSGRTSTTRIQIHPPELGQLDIKIEHKGKFVQAEIITRSQVTKEFLEAHLDQFKELLSGEDLNVESFKIRSDEMHFSKTQNQNQSGENFMDDPQKGMDDLSHGMSDHNEAHEEEIEKLKYLISQAQRGPEDDVLKINVKV
ncbi:MAG: flagellar hook-length control protein FliK [Deltaproteobacteria bacterium]|nr:flagellar hook-length control protein FliK [Deltaproteobacteria bacterium]